MLSCSHIQGHHIYCSSWTPIIGEQLVLRTQSENEHSEHAVAVFKDGDDLGMFQNPRGVDLSIISSTTMAIWAFVKLLSKDKSRSGIKCRSPLHL